MATSTFDRRLEISSPDDLKKLIHVMNTDTPTEPLSRHPYSDAERDRSECLFKQCLFRSRR